jgi:hypothetical protein
MHLFSKRMKTWKDFSATHLCEELFFLSLATEILVVPIGVLLGRIPINVVIEPVDDDIPDPEVDFEACVKAVVNRMHGSVKSLSRADRHAYFLSKARNSAEWCRRTNAPAELTRRVEHWLDRLERKWPS